MSSVEGLVIPYAFPISAMLEMVMTNTTEKNNRNQFTTGM